MPAASEQPKTALRGCASGELFPGGGRGAGGGGVVGEHAQGIASQQVAGCLESAGVVEGSRRRCGRLGSAKLQRHQRAKRAEHQEVVAVALLDRQLVEARQRQQRRGDADPRPRGRLPRGALAPVERGRARPLGALELAEVPGRPRDGARAARRPRLWARGGTRVGRLAARLALALEAHRLAEEAGAEQPAELAPAGSAALLAHDGVASGRRGRERGADAGHRAEERGLGRLLELRQHRVAAAENDEQPAVELRCGGKAEELARGDETGVVGGVLVVGQLLEVRKLRRPLEDACKPDARRRHACICGKELQCADIIHRVAVVATVRPPHRRRRRLVKPHFGCDKPES